MPTEGKGEATATTEESSPLTLWKLLESLLALAITLMLARNVPGLLELTLRRRKMLDSGGRIALRAYDGVSRFDGLDEPRKRDVDAPLSPSGDRLTAIHEDPRGDQGFLRMDHEETVDLR